MSNLAIARLQKEVTMLQKDPPPGAWCGLVEGKLTELEAGIQGPAGTVYEAGVFKLSVHIPTRYEEVCKFVIFIKFKKPSFLNFVFSSLQI